MQSKDRTSITMGKKALQQKTVRLQVTV